MIRHTQDGVLWIHNDAATDNLKPLQECEGNCLSHADCDGDLLCLVRGFTGTAVPGCMHDFAHETEAHVIDFCIDRNQGNNMRFFGDPPHTDIGGLMACEGDCDAHRFVINDCMLLFLVNGFFLHFYCILCRMSTVTVVLVWHAYRGYMETLCQVALVVKLSEVKQIIVLKGAPLQGNSRTLVEPQKHLSCRCRFVRGIVTTILTVRATWYASKESMLAQLSPAVFMTA